MAHEAAGAHDDPNNAAIDVELQREASEAALDTAGEQRADVSLAELQERFALLQRDYEVFKEGQTRPSTQAGGRPPNAAQPAAAAALRVAAARAANDGGAGKATAAAGPSSGEPRPRSQSVPTAARMRRNAPPAAEARRQHPPDESARPRPSAPPGQPQQPAGPNAGGPGIPRGLRAPSPGAPSSAGGPAQPPAGVPRPRPAAIAAAAGPERRVPSAQQAQQPRGVGNVRDAQAAAAAADAAKQLPAANAAPKKKKKPERPPWRDDFVADASPWSQELAQEAAAAAAAADSRRDVTPLRRDRERDKDRDRDREPGPSRVPGPGGKAPGRGWRGVSSDGAAGDGRAAGAGGGREAEGPKDKEAGGPPGSAPQQAAPRRKAASPPTARARAAAVAAAMEAAAAQQAARPQVTKGGMMLVIPTGPGPAPALPEALRGPPGPAAPPAGAAANERGSLIPSSSAPMPVAAQQADGNDDESRRSDSRPRTQQSRIPAFGGWQQSPPRIQGGNAPPPLQQQQQQRQAQGQGEFFGQDPKQAAQHQAGGPSSIRSQVPTAVVAAAAAGRCAVPGGPGGAPLVNRLVVDEGVSMSLDGANDPLGHSGDKSGTPSSTGTNGNPQRKRRQWEVPGAAGTPTSGPQPPTAGLPAGVQHSGEPGPDGSGGRPAFGHGPLVPTPPSSRPPSRPGSRPGSRGPSTNGEALGPPQPPGSPLDHLVGHGGRVSADGRRVSSPSFKPAAPPGAPRPSTGGNGDPVGAPVALPGGGHGTGEVGSGNRRTSWGQVPLPAAASAPCPSGPGALAAGEAGSGAAVQASVDGPHGVARSVQGPGGLRDKADYLRKLSALKRPLPNDPTRRATEEAGQLAAAVAAAGAAGGVGGSGSGGGSAASQGRKWMEPGTGDAPLSAAPVDAVGSAPAAVRAVRNRVHSADAHSGGGSGAGGAPGDDPPGAADQAAAPRKIRPTRGRSQVQLTRGAGDGPWGEPLAPPPPGGPEQGTAAEAGPPSPRGGQGRGWDHSPAQVQSPPDRPAEGASKEPGSPTRHEVRTGPARPSGASRPPWQSSVDDGGASDSGDKDAEQPEPAAAAAPPPGGDGGAGGGISAEQYLAFAAEHPEVAMAAAQAVLAGNAGRARARWNVPPPLAGPLDPLQARPQPHPQSAPGSTGPLYGTSDPQAQSQPPLAAAMVSASGMGGGSVALVTSPGQSPGPQGPGHPAEGHDLRRANSEGPRALPGRPGFLQEGPAPLGAPLPPPQLGPLGPVHGAPVVGGGPYGGAPPQPPAVQLQGLFPGGGGGGPGGGLGWPGHAEGLQDGSGRLGGFGGVPYTSPLQPIRPAMPPGGDVWHPNGPGLGPGPPPPPGHMHPPLPPQAPGHWNGGYQGYGPVPRNTGHVGVGDMMDPMGPAGMMDPHRAPPMKRGSIMTYDAPPPPGYGSGPLGPGYGSGLPPGGFPPGPGPGPPGVPGPGPALPDYMRVSASRMVAGWSAPNAKHGALSGFNDVWQHRNNSRAPPAQQPPQPGLGYGGPGPGPGPGPAGPGYGPGGGMPPMVGMGNGGGGARMGGPPPEDGYPPRAGTGFEGLSLAEVLASKPKKEAPNFKKKT